MRHTLRSIHYHVLINSFIKCDINIFLLLCSPVFINLCVHSVIPSCVHFFKTFQLLHTLCNRDHSNIKMLSSLRTCLIVFFFVLLKCPIFLPFPIKKIFLQFLNTSVLVLCFCSSLSHFIMAVYCAC